MSRSHVVIFALAIPASFLVTGLLKQAVLNETTEVPAPVAAMPGNSAVATTAKIYGQYPQQYTIDEISPGWYAITDIQQNSNPENLVAGLKTLVGEQGCVIRQVTSLQDATWGSHEDKGYTNILVVECAKADSSQ